MSLFEIPDEFCNRISGDGKEANLADLQLHSVPDWLRELTALTRLDLSGNRLTAVPEWLGQFTALTELYLGGNRLTALPDSLGGLTALSELYLGGNRLTTLPESLGNLTALTRLFLHGNRLTAVPESLGNLTALTRLFLHGNRLTAVPESLGNLTALTRLSVHENQLTAVPESLGNLTALTELDLGLNYLTELPDSLGNVTGITRLSLHGNLLGAVPEWLGNLTRLTHLYLGANQLTAVPEWLENLPELTELELGDNQLAEVPESVGGLTALTWLDLHGNQLTRLPLRLADLLDDNLQLLVDGNPLAEPLAELAARGRADLARFLRSLHDATPQFEAKMVLVGEGYAGKTSLVAALKDAPFVEGRQTTHGIEISPLAIRHPTLGTNITVRAWDFGGQEVYQITHQFFFTRHALYLVVWTAGKSEEQDEAEGWLRRIKLRVGHDACVLLVATHCAERQPEIDDPLLELAFPGLLRGLLKTDSKTDLGIEGLREAIGQETARLPQMGQPISPRWLAAREHILAYGQAEPRIWYSEFAEICQRHGLSEPEASTLAKVMHDLGQVIYYADDEGLRDIIVLNPEWLTKAISDVLQDETTKQDGGILEHARLKEIWHSRADGYGPQYYPYFLRLMEKFDISYRLNGDEARSLVAQLVPHRRPALPWQPGSEPPAGFRTLTLVCRLSESAPGLIPWLTVRHHRDSTGVYWRHGVFLRHWNDAYDSEALLELRGGTELVLHVRAPSPDLYFHVLRDSIEDLIRRRWPGLDSHRMFIPCPGQIADDRPCPGLFPLTGLLTQRASGRTTVTCMECPAAPEISRLLTGFTEPAAPLSVQLKAVQEQLAEMSAGIVSIQGKEAEIADMIRRAYRILSTEVTDCPRLFTLSPFRPSGIKRVRAYQDHYRLTLCCEHPGAEHAWQPATYDLDVPKEWFARIAPYAALVIQVLQLVVPLAGAVAVAVQPAAYRGDLQARLAVMEALVADLPATAESRVEQALGQPTGELTEAQGKGLRALRAVIFKHDKLGDFGGLRGVHSPSGDLLWVCEEHYASYDPGLPIVR